MCHDVKSKMSSGAEGECVGSSANHILTQFVLCTNINHKLFGFVHILKKILRRQFWRESLLTAPELVFAFSPISPMSLILMALNVAYKIQSHSSVRRTIFRDPAVLNRFLMRMVLMKLAVSKMTSSVTG